MKTIHTIAELRQIIKSYHSMGETVAFVPTMGNLHAGHISLIAKAKEIATHVVSSVFVNPLQFCEGEDFGTYPRTLKEDQQKLEKAGADLLFAPAVTEMYPNGNKAMTQVLAPNEITDTLCGSCRPGHFSGVTTVVAKLFGMVQPDIAVFGEKDFQQLAVIRRMVVDLSMPIEILGMPTVRESDGLAMSSRNAYLNTEDRAQAPILIDLLNKTKEKIIAGNRDYKELENSGRDMLLANSFVPDYFVIREQATLKDAEKSDKNLVILLAAKIGETRLIDNISFQI